MLPKTVRLLTMVNGSKVTIFNNLGVVLGQHSTVPFKSLNVPEKTMVSMLTTCDLINVSNSAPQKK